MAATSREHGPLRANTAITRLPHQGRPSVHPRLGREGLNVVAHRLQVDRPIVDAGLARLGIDPDRRMLQPVLVLALGIVLKCSESRISVCSVSTTAEDLMAF